MGTTGCTKTPAGGGEANNDSAGGGKAGGGDVGGGGLGGGGEGLGGGGAFWPGCVKDVDSCTHAAVWAGAHAAVSAVARPDQRM